MKRTLLKLLFLGLLLHVFFSQHCFALPPITVEGNTILFGGREGSLAGNSFFWSNNHWGGERYYNHATVAKLKQECKTTIIRAAMGVEDSGGYIEDPVSNTNRVKALVDAAIAEDLYVIIDWHSHHAENYRSQAVEFFREMAVLYGLKHNVIFEVYNEPINASWADIKSYAEPVIAAIRGTGSDNLIIVGTPFYSQHVDVASNDPISGHNIAYTLHFYAGTHREELRQKATTARNNGIALFVTEWGTVQASGDGAVDNAETDTWMQYLQNNHISHLNWAVNDKQEGASFFKPGSSTIGNWTLADLTVSGIKVFQIISNWKGVDLSGPDPGTGPAEPDPGTDPSEPEPPVISYPPGGNSPQGAGKSIVSSIFNVLLSE